MRDPYHPYDALIAPARPTASLRRLILGISLLVVLVFSLALMLSGVLDALLPQTSGTASPDDVDIGRSPASVLLNLFVFALLIAALAMTARAVHGRDLPGFVGNWRFARMHFGRVCLYLLGLQFALSILLPASPDLQPSPNLAFPQWLVLMPLALPALLIQTGAEELVFRGYLQSQLAARFRDPRIWLIVPSVLFGLLHHDPQVNGAATWLVVIWATLFGLAAADLTARTGTLGAAIALHFMNNFYAIFLVAPQGYFDGMSLYTLPFSMNDADAVWVWAPVDLMLILISWLTARLALRV